MLNRRYLRIKVFLELYSYFQGSPDSIPDSEKSLLKSIAGIWKLYLSMLSFLTEIQHAAELLIEQRMNKKLPLEEDLNPNRRFVDLPFFKALAENSEFKREAHENKVNWQKDHDIVSKIFKEIINGEMYAKYMVKKSGSFEEDKEFILDIYKNYIADHDLLHHLFEETNIHWYDDITLINLTVIKTIQNLKPPKDGRFSTHLLPALYKDAEDDALFIKILLRKTISDNKFNQDLIAEKTKNWEVDRIALIDVLLMKMALTELVHLKNIPIKVTLNEYIEISKNYSTPKSKIFINGVLDKLVADLKREGKINKEGRGLLN